MFLLCAASRGAGLEGAANSGVPTESSPSCHGPCHLFRANPAFGAWLSQGWSRTSFASSHDRQTQWWYRISLCQSNRHQRFKFREQIMICDDQNHLSINMLLTFNHLESSSQPLLLCRSQCHLHRRQHGQGGQIRTEGCWFFHLKGKMKVSKHVQTLCPKLTLFHFRKFCSLV